MAEHALDSLSATPGTPVSVGAGKGADCVTGILAHEAGNAAFPADRALRLQFAGGAIGRTASVDANLACPVGAAVTEGLVCWAAIGVGLPVVAEGITGEEGVALAAAVDDRNVRRDVPLNQPAKQRTNAIRLVAERLAGAMPSLVPARDTSVRVAATSAAKRAGVASTSRMQSVSRSSSGLMA
jgi:hypothetical protein